MNLFEKPLSLHHASRQPRPQNDEKTELLRTVRLLPIKVANISDAKPKDYELGF